MKNEIRQIYFSYLLNWRAAKDQVNISIISTFINSNYIGVFIFLHYQCVMKKNKCVEEP